MYTEKIKAYLRELKLNISIQIEIKNLCCCLFCFTELVKKYSNYLTDMEFEELRVYKEIWYFGQNANKNYSNKVSASTTNSGYDDENGNYKIVRI